MDEKENFHEEYYGRFKSPKSTIQEGESFGWDKDKFKNFMNMYIYNAIDYWNEHSSAQQKTINILLQHIGFQGGQGEIPKTFSDFCDRILSDDEIISVLSLHIMRYLDGKNLEGKQYLKDHPNTLPEIKPKSYTKEQFVEYDSPLCLQDFFDLFEQNKMYRLFIYVFLRYLHKNSALYQQMKNAYKSRQETELDGQNTLAEIEAETNKEIMEDLLYHQPYRVVEGEVVPPYDDPVYNNIYIEKEREEEWEEEQEKKQKEEEERKKYDQLYGKGPDGQYYLKF